jgi:hypothetical protein
VGLPETRYAMSGDVAIAYQIVSDGPFDVVWAPGAVSNVELNWQDGPTLARGLRAQAAPGEVLVSQTVKDLVAGSGLAFEERGTAELKGVPGEWRLYAVADAAA